MLEVEAGPDAVFVLQDGLTSLMTAAVSGDFKLSQLLLEEKADVTAVRTVIRWLDRIL